VRLVSMRTGTVLVMCSDEERALHELTKAATAWAAGRRGIEVETIEERNLRTAIDRYRVTDTTLHPDVEARDGT
jgi:hypothetical protein